MSVSQPVAVSPLPGSAKHDLASMLSRRMRVTSTDGRIFIGFFACLDKGGNVVLTAADEHRNDKKRFVGTIMLQRMHIVTAEIEVGSVL
eukprot:jgi/Hompol1/5397/HPOL_004403-RA